MALWSTREARPEPLEPAFRALVERDDATVLVGTLEEHVVAYGVAQIEVLRDASRLGVISEIYVQPEARAVGIGELLVERLVASAPARAASGVGARRCPAIGRRRTSSNGPASPRILVMHHSAFRAAPMKRCPPVSQFPHHDRH